MKWFLRVPVLTLVAGLVAVSAADLAVPVEAAETATRPATSVRTGTRRNHFM